MHYLWGSYPILFRSLLLCFYHNIFWSISSVCFWRTSLFFLVLVPSWKVWRVWFICWNLALFGSCLSHSLIFAFTFLNEISFWACVFWLNSYALWLLPCSLVELCDQSCVDLVLWYNLDSLFMSHFWCAFLVYLVFCSNYISFWFLKVLCMYIYYMYILRHACFLWSNT